MKESLNQLGQEILEINRNNGWKVCTPDDWGDHYKLCTMIALIHSEASEGLEAIRNQDKINFAEEMADTLIRVLDCACGLGIDMDREVAAKLDKNKLRGIRHGGKAV